MTLVLVAPACALLLGLLEVTLSLPTAVRSFEKHILQPLTMGDVAAVALCCLYLSIQVPTLWCQNLFMETDLGTFTCILVCFFYLHNIP